MFRNLLNCFLLLGFLQRAFGEEFTCAGKDGRYHPHPTDCEKYYQCWEGKAYPSTCQPGLLWNQNCPCCDHAVNVDCSRDTPDSTPGTKPDSTPGTRPDSTPGTTPGTQDDTPTGYKRVCYHTNWSQYRRGAGAFFPRDIDPFLCTHLIYSFANLPMNTYELTTYEFNDIAHYKEFQSLKKDNPALKTLLAVGGWNAASLRFSNMVTDSNLRRKFVTTSVQFLRDHGFDGLDLDWEYPAERGGRTSDKQNLVLLLKELLEEFQREAAETNRARLLLTAAVPAGKYYTDTGYNVIEIQKYLDFINLMSYDLHGSWESKAGHNSPLFSDASESGSVRQLNMEWAANYWHTQGTPKDKLVIGLAAYGRGFRLSNPSQHALGSPTSGPSPAGTYTGEAGFYAYYEICDMPGTRNWMTDSQVPYLVTPGGLWIGYDDEQSFRTKLNWVKEQKYGGAMIWSIALDDFRKTCSKSKRRYPLTSLMRDILVSNMTTSSTSATETTSASTTNIPVTTSATAAPVTTLTTFTSTSATPSTTTSTTTRSTSVAPVTTSATAASTSTTVTPSTTTSTTRSTSAAPVTTSQTSTPFSTSRSSTSATSSPTTMSSTTPATVTTSSTTSITSPTSESPENINCQGRPWEYFPDPKDCNKYYECSGGVKYHRVCPPGLHWRPACSCCDYPRNSNCGVTSNPETTAKVSTSVTSRETTPSTKATTQGIPPSVDNSFCANRQSGLYAVQSDCKKYYNCGNGRTFVYACPPGTAFHAERKYCDHLVNVDCSGRSG